MAEIGHKKILTLVTMTILADSGKTELKTGFEIVEYAILVMITFVRICVSDGNGTNS